MSFKVGQILSSKLGELLIPVWSNENRELQVQDIQTTKAGSLSTDQFFIDKGISIIGNFQPGTYYYVKLAIQRSFEDINQDLTLRLVRKEELQESSQYIDNFTIFAPNKDGKTSKYAYYETIIAPNNTYDQLAIILSRTVIDYYSENDPETGLPWDPPEKWREYKGREIKIEPSLCKIAIINNVIGSNTLSTSTLNKIGIQGPPGLLMCINGEPIRIGPSGIYEIRNGYKIKFLSFIIRESEEEDGTYKTDNFIVDYQYGTED